MNYWRYSYVYLLIQFIFIFFHRTPVNKRLPAKKPDTSKPGAKNAVNKTNTLTRRPDNKIMSNKKTNEKGNNKTTVPKKETNGNTAHTNVIMSIFFFCLPFLLMMVLLCSKFIRKIFFRAIKVIKKRKHKKIMKLQKRGDLTLVAMITIQWRCQVGYIYAVIFQWLLFISLWSYKIIISYKLQADETIF